MQTETPAHGKKKVEEERVKTLVGAVRHGTFPIYYVCITTVRHFSRVSPCICTASRQASFAVCTREDFQPQESKSKSGIDVKLDACVSIYRRPHRPHHAVYYYLAQFFGTSELSKVRFGDTCIDIVDGYYHSARVARFLQNRSRT